MDDDTSSAPKGSVTIDHGFVYTKILLFFETELLHARFVGAIETTAEASRLGGRYQITTRIGLRAE